MDRFPANPPKKLTHPVISNVFPFPTGAGLWLEMAANDEEENDKQIVSQAASALIKAAYHSSAESRSALLNLQPRNTDEPSHRHKYCLLFTLQNQRLGQAKVAGEMC